MSRPGSGITRAACCCSSPRRAPGPSPAYACAGWNPRPRTVSRTSTSTATTRSASNSSNPGNPPWEGTSEPGPTGTKRSSGMSSAGVPAPMAVVTGASSGLGAIFAQRLGERGFNLVLTGRDTDRLEEVRRRVVAGARSCAVTLVTADLATGDGVLTLLRELGDRPVDLLVNNAGFGTYGPFDRSDTAREMDVIGVDIAALVRLTRAVLPGMVERGHGGVLNVASTIAFRPAPYRATYGAAKAFVLSFSQALWQEARHRGVTVTALC